MYWCRSTCICYNDTSLVILYCLFHSELQAYYFYLSDWNRTITYKNWFQLVFAGGCPRTLKYDWSVRDRRTENHNCFLGWSLMYAQLWSSMWQTHRKSHLSWFTRYDTGWRCSWTNRLPLHQHYNCTEKSSLLLEALPSIRIGIDLNSSPEFELKLVAVSLYLAMALSALLNHHKELEQMTALILCPLHKRPASSTS